MSKFTQEHAEHLAKLAYSKRIGSRFSDPEDLLKILRAAETQCDLATEDIEYQDEVFSDGAKLKMLQTQLNKFLYFWDRTDRRITDDVGYFSAGDEMPDIFAIKKRNDLVHDALGYLRDGLQKAVDIRSPGDGGKPQNWPALKEFVRHIHQGWMLHFGGGVPFGHEFRDCIDGSDREPVSPAAKLVVHAGRILNPFWTGRDCETAIKDIKSKSRAKVSETA